MGQVFGGKISAVQLSTSDFPKNSESVGVIGWPAKIDPIKCLVSLSFWALLSENMKVENYVCYEADTVGTQRFDTRCIL